ncbi:MAG: hypothetical protein HW383_475 [Candidatus Magasanikbacteria bacterium]|nr:hypothetical protein [Candidatus Magasanikbacteria bacterium]
MLVYYANSFIKRLKRLPDRVKMEVVQKEKIFRENPSDFRLRTHKLHGELSGLFAFSINYYYRIIFRINPDSSADFLDIGTHEIY